MALLLINTNCNYAVIVECLLSKSIRQLLKKCSYSFQFQVWISSKYYKSTSQVFYTQSHWTLLSWIKNPKVTLNQALGIGRKTNTILKYMQLESSRICFKSLLVKKLYKKLNYNHQFLLVIADVATLSKILCQLKSFGTSPKYHIKSKSVLTTCYIKEPTFALGHIYMIQ